MESQAYIDALCSHAMTIGYFDRVNAYEPKSAPGKGLTAAVWFTSVRPLPAGRGSGLASTTVRLEMTLRIYTSMLQEPQDYIDPAMMEAVDKLLNAYSGDFTLDGMIRNIDLLGAYGIPLGATSGYQRIDSKMMRIVDITIPLIINDAWEQTP
jgi:hypothetical protein